MLYLVFLLIFFVPLVLILMLKVNIVAEYVRNNEDDNISISFFTLKELLKYKFEVPLINVGSKGVEYKLVRERGKKNAATRKQSKKTGLTEFIQKMNHIWVVYRSNDEIVCKIRCFIKKNITFDEFRLKIREGTGDAALTGLVNGLLWAVSGFFLTRLFSIFKTRSKKYKSEIKIEPDYEMKDFNVDLYCIFHTKLVHIILVLIFIFMQRINAKNYNKKETGGDFNG